jgi:hypothetical protein
VVRRPRLKLALLAGLVLVAHVVALVLFHREIEVKSALPQMTAPMFTRLLQPKEPPPVLAQVERPVPRPKPRHHTAHIVRRPASAPKPTQPPDEPPPPEPSGAELAQASPAQSAASEAAPAASEAASAASQAASAASAASAAAPAPLAAASAPASSASAAQGSASAAQVAQAPASAASQPASAASAPASAASADLDTWPSDSRLNYQLTGHWRSGPVYGDARVQWQRDGAKYQVRLDVHLKLLGSLVLTSQGEVTPDGLAPGAYEELVRSRRRTVVFGPDTLNLNNDKTAPRPPGVQDTASQLVELSHRFATGRNKLAVGESVTMWLARPGGVDPWTYDIVDKERLRMPSLGEVEAYHLVPRPIPAARGNIYAEIWIAPSLQYLPVRVRMTMGNEAQVDLLVDTIQQR